LNGYKSSDHHHGKLTTWSTIVSMVSGYLIGSSIYIVKVPVIALVIVRLWLYYN